MEEKNQLPPMEQQSVFAPQGPSLESKAPSRGDGIMRGIIEYIVMLAIALLLAWGIVTFVAPTYRIPTGSMEPTIAIGNRVLSEKISYYVGTPQSGDIVTFTNPTGENEILIKRCIAVSGQTVDLRDGIVYVDGVAQSEWYTHGKRSDPLAATMPGADIEFPYSVPDGYIWVMGDNRTNSADSRYFGAIPVSSVSGRAFFTYWPLDQFGALN